MVLWLQTREGPMGRMKKEATKEQAPMGPNLTRRLVFYWQEGSRDARVFVLLGAVDMGAQPQ